MMTVREEFPVMEIPRHQAPVDHSKLLGFPCRGFNSVLQLDLSV
jgi:hypothetical protein